MKHHQFYCIESVGINRNWAAKFIFVIQCGRVSVVLVKLLCLSNVWSSVEFCWEHERTQKVGHNGWAGGSLIDVRTHGYTCFFPRRTQKILTEQSNKLTVWMQNSRKRLFSTVWKQNLLLLKIPALMPTSIVRLPWSVVMGLIISYHTTYMSNWSSSMSQGLLRWSFNLQDVNPFYWSTKSQEEITFMASID